MILCDGRRSGSSLRTQPSPDHLAGVQTPSLARNTSIVRPSRGAVAIGSCLHLDNAMSVQAFRGGRSPARPVAGEDAAWPTTDADPLSVARRTISRDHWSSIGSEIGADSRHGAVGTLRVGAWEGRDARRACSDDVLRASWRAGQLACGPVGVDPGWPEPLLGVAGVLLATPFLASRDRGPAGGRGGAYGRALPMPADGRRRPTSVAAVLLHTTVNRQRSNAYASELARTPAAASGFCPT